MSLGSVVMEAIEMARQMRADGVEETTIQAGVESLVRDKWPRGREWKYLCNECGDTGLRLESRLTPTYHYRVDVGVPCWCSLGKRFQEKERAEDFVQAGKTVKKPRTFSRFGR